MSGYVGVGPVGMRRITKSTKPKKAAVPMSALGTTPRSLMPAFATAMFSCVKKDGKSACTPDLGVGPCATPRQASQSRLTGSVRAGALRCAGSRNRAWKKM